MTKASPRSIDGLLDIMARLREPDGGCPWDIEQDFATIAPYTIEEAYEVADAIARDDMGALKEELGDLLLQVVFHAQMAREARAFDFADVTEAIVEKMVRRHPHVFGSERIADADTQNLAWEAHKAAERREKARAAPAGALDGVPLALPALMRAEKLQKRAARLGFDWPERGPVLDKITEEFGELCGELGSAGAPERVAEELGDLLFAVVNLARWLRLDPEAVLRAANEKFERRFRRVEALLATAGRSTEAATLDDLDRLWEQAKSEERRPRQGNDPPLKDGVA